MLWREERGGRKRQQWAWLLFYYRDESCLPNVNEGKIEILSHARRLRVWRIIPSVICNRLSGEAGGGGVNGCCKPPLLRLCKPNLMTTSGFLYDMTRLTRSVGIHTVDSGWMLQ